MLHRKIKILFAFGTRPEAIKLAPIINLLRKQRGKYDIRICVTAQHRTMLDQALKLFNIVPHHDLNVMSENQTLPQLTSRIMECMNGVLLSVKPDLIVVQGDTTTTATAALAGYYAKIPVVHVEAGLRTNDIYQPFPEEMNRRMTGVLATLHFVPTENARQNLLREGISDDSIYVTGNTVIDALLWIVDQQKDPSVQQMYESRMAKCYAIDLSGSVRIILVTGHRRESFGQGFKQICDALAWIARQNSDVQIVYPVHLNPNVHKQVHAGLGSIDNIHLIPPQPYDIFVYLMTKCHIVLTDSGGVQEEAPSLGKPVLVMRNRTERIEGIETGTARLVGVETRHIIHETERLLHDEGEYKKMAVAHNPYGQGNAASNIVTLLDRFFEER